MTVLIIKGIFWIVLYWLFHMKLASAEHYCEWGICKEEEYCCGPNKCCSKVEIFFTAFWVSSVVLIIIFCSRLLLFYFPRLFKYRLEKNHLIEEPD